MRPNRPNSREPKTLSNYNRAKSTTKVTKIKRSMTTSFRRKPTTAVEAEKKNRFIEKLKDHVMEKIVRENQTSLLEVDQLRMIAEEQIVKMIPNFHTPDHPTYAFMIHRAINEGRSDRESISNFIQTEYEDLPLAHESVLTFQLNKLCEKGEILLSALGCYLLPAGDYIQENLVMKEKQKNGVEKKAGKGGNFKEIEADDVPCEVEVFSKQMKGKKRRRNMGYQSGRRRSRRRQSNKSQEEETNNGGDEIIKDLGRTEGENVASSDQDSRVELPSTVHQNDEQQFKTSDEPLEPPGFPSKIDLLIKQKQAQTEGENGSSRDQNCCVALQIADVKTEEQQFGTFDEPLEPPGFPSKRDQFIEQKQQAQTEGENDASIDQNCRVEIQISDHQNEEQQFGTSDEPLEPPGCPSKRDQFIKQKQQAQTERENNTSRDQNRSNASAK